MPRLPVPFLLIALAGCCARAPDTAAPNSDPTTSASQPFERELLDAAARFRQWPRVSDHANWAPTLCRPATLQGVQHSVSTDTDTHGRKLYFLFAKDGSGYRNLGGFDELDLAARERAIADMVGQVVVKQSFHPIEVPIAAVPRLDAKLPGDRVIAEDHVITGDRAFRTGAAADLFVMLKLDPATPGTDDGWVYGTLTPDGGKVTASGRIQSCMDCHADAPRDRLFGLAPRPKRAR